MRTSTAVGMVASALLAACSGESTGPGGPPLVAEVAVLTADDWALRSPATRPSARGAAAMASVGDDQVLLFGGSDDETWVYDLSDDMWTQRSPAGPPSSRLGHALASIGGDQVLLFGGLFPLDDATWVYDLSDDTWTLKNPLTKPLARGLHAMASIGGDQVLLFGGAVFVVPPFDPLAEETWVYDLSEDTWTLKDPPARPSARSAPAMASIGGHKVVLFGGHDLETGGKSDETWVYDLSDDTWTRRNPATKPSARTHHAMASVGSQALLFGGLDEAHNLSDETWVYPAGPPLRQVAIDIKPGSNPNSIKLGSKGTIPVAILSTADFDAPAEVDRTSLTFGRTGDEASLAFCGTTLKDVNGDGRLDLVCHFKTQLTGFQGGDTEGILKGETVGGTAIEGRDAVRVVS